MVAASWIRYASDRRAVLALAALAGGLVIALMLLALAAIDGTWWTNVFVEEGRLVGPFRWFPIDPANG